MRLFAFALFAATFFAGCLIQSDSGNQKTLAIEHDLSLREDPIIIDKMETLIWDGPIVMDALHELAVTVQPHAFSEYNYFRLWNEDYEVRIYSDSTVIGQLDSIDEFVGKSFSGHPCQLSASGHVPVVSGDLTFNIPVVFTSSHTRKYYHMRDSYRDDMGNHISFQVGPGYPGSSGPLWFDTQERRDNWFDWYDSTHLALGLRTYAAVHFLIDEEASVLPGLQIELEGKEFSGTIRAECPSP